MVKIILVNKKDEVIGHEEKTKCHAGKGILHRAFSIFIFNKKGELLIQQRSKLKPLWPLYWANSACSHPRKDGNAIAEAKKRLKEELGFSAPLKSLGKFSYRARYKNGSECEIDEVMTGKYSGTVSLNPKEAADYKWVNMRSLKASIKKNPRKYVPWFKIAIKKFFKTCNWNPF